LAINNKVTDIAVPTTLAHTLSHLTVHDITRKRICALLEKKKC